MTKSQWVKLIFGLSGSLLLAGCGQAQSTNVQEDGVATVRVWTDDASSKNVMTELIDEFNNTVGQEQGIKIDYKVYGSDYQQVLSLAVANGEEPELFKSQANDLRQVITKGGAIPLEDMPGGKEYVSQFEGMLKPNESIYDGKTYAVPYSVNTIGLVYNKDMFKEAGIVDENGEAKPPETWDEMIEDVKKLTDVSKKQFGIAIPLKWDAYFDWEVRFPFFSTVGDDVFSNKEGKFDFQAYKPAMEWLLKIKEDGSYFPGAEGLDNDAARAQFSEGHIGMKFAASWDTGVYNEQFPAKIDWGVAPIPRENKDSEYLQFALSTTNLVVGRSAEKSDLNKVMTVYKWFNSDEVLGKLYSESKIIPYDTEIIKNAETVPNQKGWAEFAALLDESKTMSLGPSVTLEGADYRQVFSQIWSETVDVDEALKDLDTRYNEALSHEIENGTINIEDYMDKNFDAGKK